MENASNDAIRGNNKPAVGVGYSDQEILARLKKKEQEEENNTIRIPGWVAWAVVVAIGVAVWYWYQGLGVSQIPLCVVNTSSDAPLDVWLDGKSIGLVPRMINEDPAAARQAVLKCGPHTLEAKNGAGAVVASEKFVVEKGSNGFLWTPLPDPIFRFLIQTTDYGGSTGGAGNFPIENMDALKPLPEWVSYWFRDTPKAVSAPKGWKRTHEHALRRAANAK